MHPQSSTSESLHGYYAQGKQRNRHSGRRTSVSPERRWAIIERAGGICIYCGLPAVCVDHVVPYSYSQDNSDDNLVAACRWCNAHLSNMTFDSVRAKREYLQTQKGWTQHTSCGVRLTEPNPLPAANPTRLSHQTCPECGKEWTVQGRIKTTYCSLRCASRARVAALRRNGLMRPLVNQVCPECGGTFTHPDYPSWHQICCSESCRSKYANRGRKTCGVVTQVCPECGRSFSHAAHPSYHQICCSRSCASKKANRERAEKARA